MERKIIDASRFEFKAAGGPGTFWGYASVWDSVDRVGDLVRRGAYEATLGTFIRDGAICWGHNQSDPVATIDDAEENSKGLRITATFHSDERAQTARSIAQERLARGKGMGLSIGYSVPPGGSKRRGDGVRELTKVALYEVSLVSLPAEPRAQVTAVKAGRSTGSAPAPRSQSEQAARDYVRTALRRGTGVEPRVLDAVLRSR
jgi:HK97 family phage prohead protease